MNKDDIIRMAQECQLIGMRPHLDGIYQDSLERFAALIATHVRETEFKPDWNNYRQGVADGAAEEREACAKVCDDIFRHWLQTDPDEQFATPDADDCAKAIRARGQA